MARITGALHKDQYAFLTISRAFLLRMRNVSDKNFEENQNTFCVEKPFRKNRSVYEITWKNIIEPSRSQMTIWRMRVAFRIPKATNTHTHGICSTIPFAPQQWLQNASEC